MTDKAPSPATPASPAAVERGPNPYLEGFLAIEAELRAMPYRDVRVPNSNIDKSALAALRAVDHVQEKGRLVRMLSVLSADMLPRDIDVQLTRAARAVVHLNDAVTREAAMVRGAPVVPALLAEAKARRARMLRVLEFWFDDDRAVKANVADMKRRRGYRNLVSDLSRLAALYHEKGSLIVMGEKHFRPDDEARAHKNSEDLVDALTANRGERLRQLTNLRNRAWSFLAIRYEDLRAAHRLLFRDDPKEMKAIPPLRAAVHGSGRKGKRKSETDEPAP